MSVNANETYEVAMRHALDAATLGPASGINPRVGCVIIDSHAAAHDQLSILATGYHRGAGTSHAEVDALSRLRARTARGATAVVTLEPCNHTGNTGPCAQALIDAGIARVVYAIDDPGEESGGGAERLREAGVEVISGVLHNDVEDSLSDWLFSARHDRPFVTLKWAASLDGRIAAADGSSKWITGPEARARVHRDRADNDAIITGTGTVLADNPALTARTPRGSLFDKQPVPVVIGGRPIPADAAVRQHPKSLIELTTRNLYAALRELHHRGLRTAYVEAGPTLSNALLREGLVDEIHSYIAPTLLGGPMLAVGDLGVDSITEQQRLELRSLERLGDDILVVARPQLGSQLIPQPTPGPPRELTAVVTSEPTGGPSYDPTFGSEYDPAYRPGGEPAHDLDPNPSRESPDDLAPETSSRN